MTHTGGGINPTCSFGGELTLALFVSLYDAPGTVLDLIERIEHRTDIQPDGYGLRHTYWALEEARKRGEVTRKYVKVLRRGGSGHGVQRRRIYEYALTTTGEQKVERILGRIASMLGGSALWIMEGDRPRLRFPVSEVLTS